MTAAPLQKKREIIIDTEGKAIDNGTSISGYPSTPQSNDNEDHLLQFSVPLKDILGPLLELKAWNEEAIWFDVVFDKRTSDVISANIGKKSREIMAKKSQRQIHRVVTKGSQVGSISIIRRREMKDSTNYASILRVWEACWCSVSPNSKNPVNPYQ